MKAMTTRQAEEAFLCDHCKAGCDCPYCGCTCLESKTCSLRCKACDERVWFQGDAKDVGPTFDCPYCKARVKNIFHRPSLKKEPIKVGLMRPGMKVHHQPTPSSSVSSNGIIKGIQTRMYDGTPQVFVVYNCDGNWDRYQDYTGENTDPKDLYPGWK